MKKLKKRIYIEFAFVYSALAEIKQTIKRIKAKREFIINISDLEDQAKEAARRDIENSR